MKSGRYISVLLLLSLLTSVAIVHAQDGGGRGGTGGDRPTRTATDRTGQSVPVGTPSRTFSGSEGQVQLPDDWRDFTLPEEVPASRAELEAMLTDTELPIDWDSDSLNLEGGSDTAYAAIVGFAQLYLGTGISPLYADETTTTALHDRIRNTDALSTELAQALADLPPELQQIFAAADGVVYWAILTNGAASVYTGEACSTPTCSVTIDNLQINITTASMGVYTLYVDGSVDSSIAAYNLIVQAYPMLMTYELTPAYSDSGYTFTAYDYVLTGTDVSATGTIAGVIPIESGKSLAYVIVGIGDGYVSLMR